MGTSGKESPLLEIIESFFLDSTSHHMDPLQRKTENKFTILYLLFDCGITLISDILGLSTMKYVMFFFLGILVAPHMYPKAASSWIPNPFHPFSTSDRSLILIHRPFGPNQQRFLKHLFFIPTAPHLSLL